METSWEIEDMTISQIVSQGDNLSNNTLYKMPVCAKLDHCYKFRIQDTAGNGIHPGQGGYNLYVNGQEIARGGIFEAEETVDLLACCSLFEVRLIGGAPCDDFHEEQVTAYCEGGVAPFTFNWSTGSTFSSIQWPEEGDFPVSVEVEDASGCLAADTLEIANMAPLAVEVLKTDLTGTGVPNGTAEVLIQHGTPPFHYFWSNGATTSALTGLAAGSYQVTVLDGAGCMAVAETEILSGLIEPGEKRPVLQVFPNPSTQEIQVVIQWPQTGVAWLRILQTDGTEIYVQKLELLAGETRVSLALPGLTPGLYWLSMETDRGAVTRAIVRL